MLRILKVAGAGLIGFLLLTLVFAGSRGALSRFEQARQRAGDHSRGRDRVEEYRALAQRSVATHCEQSARLDLEAVLGPPPQGGEAGGFLNPRLAWIPPRPVRAPLGLDDEVRKRMRRDDWPQAEASILPDSSWLRELEPYGRWSLMPSGLSGFVPLDQVAYPTPSGPDLLIWARVRWVKALQHGDWASARLELRRVSWLMLRSAEPLLGALPGGLLRIEGEARTVFQQRGGDVSGWPAPDLEAGRRIWSVIQLASILSRPLVEGAVRERALLCTPAELRCMVTTQLVTNFAIVRKAASSDELAQVEGVLRAEAPCDLELARALWSSDVRTVALPPEVWWRSSERTRQDLRTKMDSESEPTDLLKALETFAPRN